MKRFVSGDPFIAFSKRVDEKTSFFQPEDGTKGTAEEDSFDDTESEQAGEEVFLGGDPSECPVGFLFHAGDVLDGFKELLFPERVFDEGIDHQRVGLAVDVLHHGLKGVETAGFGDFDFGAEILDEVFEDDTIGAGEKGEDGFDKVAFVVIEFSFPVGLVTGEIDFFGGPEGILVVFIGFPNRGVLDREETVTLCR
jgi:hypothetical protein